MRLSLCCSVLTSGQAGASRIYLSLDPLNSDGGRKSHIFGWNKSFIIELCPLKRCCPSMGHRFWTFMLATCEKNWIEDVRIMGFYTSAETARQNLVCSSEIVATWGILTVQVRVNLGYVLHFAWHCESFVNSLNNLLREKHQWAKLNPNVSFGRAAFSADERLYSLVRSAVSRAMKEERGRSLSRHCHEMRGITNTYGTRSYITTMVSSAVNFSSLWLIVIGLSPATEIHVTRIERCITLAWTLSVWRSQLMFKWKLTGILFRLRALTDD